MSLLLRIAERVLNRPLLVHPDKVPFVLAVLDGRIPLGDVSELREIAEAHVNELPTAAQLTMRGPNPGASRFVGDRFETDDRGNATARLPYQRTKDGTAVITVTGALINRGAFVGSSSGETSYEGIKHQLAMALADPKVASILLDIESPGGEAVGAMEAATAVRAANKVKPVTAVVNGMAASAAYALASGAGKIVTTPSGVVGSIGVVLLHADFSRQLDKAGITPTLIFAGAHKVDGNPFEPLSETVREDLQREVMQFYDLFVGTVADGRAAMSPQGIRATEARVFIGEEAVKAGLADEVGTFETVLSELSQRNSARQRAFNGAFMSEKTPQPAADQSGNTHTQAQVDTAVANAKAEERKRQQAILNSEQAKGRAKFAHHLAYETDMSAEAAIVMLGKAGLEAAEGKQPSIAERMGGQGEDLALRGPMKPGGNAAAAVEVTIESAESVYARREKEARAA